MNMELMVFKHKLKQGSYTKLQAIDALKLYAAEGEPIPQELLSYLDQVCDAWAGVNKVEFKNIELKWSSLVWDTRLMYRIHKSSMYSVEDALGDVSRINNVGYTTLREHYRGTKYKAAKDDADMIYEASGGW